MQNDDFCIIRYDLDPLPSEFIQGLCDHRHPVSEVLARLDQVEERYAPDNVFFSYNSVLTFYFDLETWLKVTTHSLPKFTLWVTYEPDLAKRR